MLNKYLVPIIDDFTKNHKGKQITASDVEALYNDLNKALSRDRRILDKWGGGIDQDSVHKDMAKQMAETLNTESKLSKSEQLVKGFGEFCKKLVLERLVMLV